MDTITPFFVYAAALFIAAAIPGPGIAALVGQSLGGNARRAGFFMLGIALGDVTWLTVAIVGLAAVAKTFASAFVVIKLFGARCSENIGAVGHGTHACGCNVCSVYGDFGESKANYLLPSAFAIRA